MAHFIIDDEYLPLQKFGRTPDIDASGTNEDVWDGTAAYVFPTSATAMTISSESANDAVGGTGVQRVRVWGLDRRYNEVVQDLDMSGVTGVAIPTAMRRVYRAYALTSGSVETNDDNIWIGTGSITDGVPATVYAGILDGLGQTLMAIYTIPLSTYDNVKLSGGTILRWYATVGAVQSAFAVVALQTRAHNGSWRTRRVAGIAEGGPIDEDIVWGIGLQPKSDVRIRVLSNGANNSTIEAGFDIALKKA